MNLNERCERIRLKCADEPQHPLRAKMLVEFIEAELKEVRNEALEEAAKTTEDVAAHWNNSVGPSYAHSTDEAVVKIRALKANSSSVKESPVIYNNAAYMLNLCCICLKRQCNNPSPCCKECDSELVKTRQPLNTAEQEEKL